jgi:hypothetical protein
MAVTPGRKFNEVLSAKDLNPRTVRFFRYIRNEWTLEQGFRQVQNHKIWEEVIHTTIIDSGDQIAWLEESLGRNEGIALHKQHRQVLATWGWTGRSMSNDSVR